MDEASFFLCGSITNHVACGALLWKYEECLQTLRVKSQKQCICLLARMLKFGRVCGVNTEWTVSSGSFYVNEI